MTTQGNCVWALALMVLLLGGCASDNDAGAVEAEPVAAPAAAAGETPELDHIDPVVRRLRALEAQVSTVGAKKAWSGQYTGAGVVKRAWLRGIHVLLEVWNVETREYAIHCVDSVKGRPRWILVLGPNPLARPPHIGIGTIAFITDVDGGMIVVNSRTGSRVWHKRTKLGVVPCSDATSNEDTVYVASYLSHRMVAVAAADGRKAWDFRTAGACRTVPVVTRGMARQLLIYGTDEGDLVAIDAKGHAEVPPTSTKWARRLNGAVRGNPVFAMVGEGDSRTGLVVVPCEDGWLYGIDPATGRSRWVLRTDKAFTEAPAVIGNRVFARNENRMFCIDAVTGERLWNPAGSGGETEYQKSQLFGLPRGYESADQVLAAGDEFTYFRIGRDTVMRCKSATGEVVGEVPLRAIDFFLTNQATQSLVVGTADGYVVAFN